MFRFTKVLTAMLLIASFSHAQTQLTVYNHGEALVKEQFTRQVPSGKSTLEIEDVAETIIPASVKLSGDDQLQVLEQNFRYDLVNQNKLLKKYLEAEISVIMQNDKKLTGELLSYNDKTLVIRGRTGTDIIQRSFVGSIKCPSPKERLYVRPTLSWDVNNSGAINQQLDLSYMTRLINWRAEYVAVINEDDTEINFSSWINMQNNSGKQFKNTKLKLVAGDLHRASNVRPSMAMQEDRIFKSRGSAVVVERDFFEYHIYEIGFPVTINNREEKQIQWLNPTLISAQKRYVFNSRNSELSNIPIKIIFINDEKTGTGMPLPAGVVRLFKEDTDGALELVGEDNLKHVSKDDKVTLEVGKAYDVKGKYEVLDRRSKQNRYKEDDIRITLVNRKDTAVKIDVLQGIAHQNWAIVNASAEYEKVDASRVKFTIPVPANKEVVLTYTSRVDLK